MATQTRTIVGAVIQSGRMYKAGDEDALAAAMQGRSTAHLIEKGAITGKWDEPQAEATASDAASEDETGDEDIEDIEDEAEDETTSRAGQKSARRRSNRKRG